MAPAYYTVAGAMQEMSVSYGQQNATSKASTAAEGVVAELVKGPSAAGVTSITDALLTVYAQSTLRYAANMTLDAHLPGNGMGGSTAPVETTVPATVLGVGVTACGVDQLSLTDAECQEPSKRTAPLQLTGTGSTLPKASQAPLRALSTSTSPCAATSRRTRRLAIPSPLLWQTQLLSRALAGWT